MQDKDIEIITVADIKDEEQKDISFLLENFDQTGPARTRKTKYGRITEKIENYLFLIMTIFVIFMAGYIVRDMQANVEQAQIKQKYEYYMDLQEREVTINGEPIDARDFF